MMKKFVSWFLGLLGVAVFLLGAYVSLRVMFVGGIVDIISVIKSQNVDGNTIALAIVKIFFCGIPFLFGSVVAYILEVFAIDFYKKSSRG